MPRGEGLTRAGERLKDVIGAIFAETRSHPSWGFVERGWSGRMEEMPGDMSKCCCIG